MVFKRKKFTTSEEILDLIKTDNEIMHSTAVIYFYRSDKVSGKIYLREGTDAGLVYAAHVSNMPFEIGKRLKQYIDIDEYNDIIRQVGGDETDPNIARLVVARQLVAEKVVDAYIREYLFDAATEIFSWTEVISKWEVGTETRDFASKQHIRLELLQQRAKERSAQYQSMISDTKLTEDQVAQLKVMRKGADEEFAAIKNQNLRTILNASNGKNTILEIRQMTGMLKVPAFMGIHSLWKAGLVQLIAGDVPVYPPVDVEPEEKPENEAEVEAIPLEEYTVTSMGQGSNDNTATTETTANDDDEEEEEDDSFIVGETVDGDKENQPTSHTEAIVIEPIPAQTPLEENDSAIEQDTYENTQSEMEDLLASFMNNPASNEDTDDTVDNDDNDDSVIAPVEPEDDHSKEETMNQPVKNNLSILDKLNGRIESLQEKVAISESDIKSDDIEIRKVEFEIATLESELASVLEHKNTLIHLRKQHIEENTQAQGKLDELFVTLDNLVG